MNQPIQPFDWHRMLFGDAPAEFAVEVIARALILYLYMLLMMKLFGKRMKGELSATEMVVIITLGSSISVPMQVPEEGFLIGVVLLTCFLILERMLTWLTLKSPQFEVLTQGSVAMLVKDGELQWRQMKEIKITQEQIFAVLRQHHIEHLGQVERLYIEAGNGGFSLYRRQDGVEKGIDLFDASNPPANDRKNQDTYVN